MAGKYEIVNVAAPDPNHIRRLAPHVDTSASFPSQSFRFIPFSSGTAVIVFKKFQPLAFHMTSWLEHAGVTSGVQWIGQAADGGAKTTRHDSVASLNSEKY